MRSTALIAAAMLAMLSARPSIAEEAPDGSRQAVENLNAYAAYKMGQYDAARAIWEDLAARGNTTALINLANMFQQGQGVSEDQRRGLDYVRKAAELGDRRAQYELGMAYEKGHVVDRDIGLAAEWLRKAAEAGNPDGQFAYGVMLATASGAGLDKASAEDRAEALDWLRRADAAGHGEAGDYIGIIEAGG